MTIDTTRRGLLKAAPAAAIAITIPVTLAAAPAPDRSAWEAAMAAYRTARAEDDAFTPGYIEAWRRCHDECERVPHVTLSHDPQWGGLTATTSSTRYVKDARRDVALLDAGKMRFDPLPDLIEHERLMRALVAADDERNTAIQAIRDRYNMDELDERADALGDLVADTCSAVMDTPAPDLAALRWKLDHITEEAVPDNGSLPLYGAKYVRQLIADIARLLPEGA